VVRSDLEAEVLGCLARGRASKLASTQNASHIRSRIEVGSMFLGRIAG